MKRLAILAFATLLLATCASDNDQGGYSPRGRPMGGGGYGGDGGTYVAQRPTGAGLDMLPPADWWHQPMLADPVKLSADQMTSLDKIAQDQGNDASRIETDMTIAVRDLRTQLDSSQPSSADIVTAGQRIRALRDSLFDRQLQMLAAERTVLTQQQWQTLQNQLQQRRSQRNMDNGYPRRGGRGMGGGRGRGPGM